MHWHAQFISFLWKKMFEDLFERFHIFCWEQSITQYKNRWQLCCHWQKFICKLLSRRKTKEEWYVIFNLIFFMLSCLFHFRTFFPSQFWSIVMLKLNLLFIVDNDLLELFLFSMTSVICHWSNMRTTYNLRQSQVQFLGLQLIALMSRSCNYNISMPTRPFLFPFLPGFLGSWSTEYTFLPIVVMESSLNDIFIDFGVEVCKQSSTAFLKSNARLQSTFTNKVYLQNYV